jgi:uncharacterized membrane protein
MPEKPTQPPTPEATARAIRKNIESIARLEKEYRLRRNMADRVADMVGGFSGSITFVLLHALFFTIWIAGNLGYIPRFPRFDRFPFLFLSLAVNLEAIFLSTFVLMKQERMSRRADQRAHLDLQINLLAEREMTLVLQMLQRISTRLGVRPASSDIEELSEETSIEALATELQSRLPPE